MDIFCKFNGGCGRNFPEDGELLAHWVSHLADDAIVPGIVVNEKLETAECSPEHSADDNTESHLPNGDAQHISEKAEPPSDPSHEVDLSEYNFQLFPELNCNWCDGLKHYDTVDPEIEGPCVKMEEILPDSSYEGSEYSIDVSSCLSIDWSELLQNESSSADAFSNLEDFYSSDSAVGFSDSGANSEAENEPCEFHVVKTENGAFISHYYDVEVTKSPRQNQGKLRPIMANIVGQCKVLSGSSALNIRNSGNGYRVPPESSKVARCASKKNARRGSKTVVVQYYSSEFILEEGLKKRKGNHPLHKPYVCPVPGCGKNYKNPNGIKYHAKYGHSAPQEFPCHCGKVYSTRHGLLAHRRNHSSVYHVPLLPFSVTTKPIEGVKSETATQR